MAASKEVFYFKSFLETQTIQTCIALRPNEGCNQQNTFLQNFFNFSKKELNCNKSKIKQFQAERLFIFVGFEIALLYLFLPARNKNKIKEILVEINQNDNASSSQYLRHYISYY